MQDTFLFIEKVYIIIMKKYLYLLIFLIIINSNNGFFKLELAEENFLKKIESSSPLTKKRLILKKEQLAKIQIPMGHKYKKRIFKYWTSDSQTIWILNSIGKYKPITAAFIVQSCKIKSAHVLIYREQHGYEIKYSAFLSQFSQIGINNDSKLNKNIDNISGATLSVNSMDRMARTALILDNISNDNKC